MCLLHNRSLTNFHNKLYIVSALHEPWDSNESVAFSSARYVFLGGLKWARLSREKVTTFPSLHKSLGKTAWIHPDSSDGVNPHIMCFRLSQTFIVCPFFHIPEKYGQKLHNASIFILNFLSLTRMSHQLHSRNWSTCLILEAVRDHIYITVCSSMRLMW